MTEMASDCRPEDPSKLSLIQWLKRAASLPIRESARRVFVLLASFGSNLLRLRRHRQAAEGQKKNLHFIWLSGRLGDIVAAEPTLRRIKRADDYIVWLCRAPYAEILRFNPNVDAIMPISSDAEAMLLRRIARARWTCLMIDGCLCNMFGVLIKNPRYPGLNSESFYKFGTLSEIRGLIAYGEKAIERPRLYPDLLFDASSFLKKIFLKAELPLLVFHPASEEYARSWTIEKARGFAAWMKENTNFNIIEVGLNPYLTADARTYLLRAELPLNCQFAIISAANVFVGVDSGFAHVAKAAEIPSVLLIGRYHSFTEHLPWHLDQADIVIRNQRQAHEIDVEEVASAIALMISRGIHNEPSSKLTQRST